MAPGGLPYAVVRGPPTGPVPYGFRQVVGVPEGWLRRNRGCGGGPSQMWGPSPDAAPGPRPAACVQCPFRPSGTPAGG
ncbi:hypothetical protein OV450_6190 [Actinobacteria bacterium OV450]|nr:hypothetical protein OV450_6190 [Actinobacteria bacterium OV450]